VSQDFVALLNKGINKHLLLEEPMMESVLPDLFHMIDMDGRYMDRVTWQTYSNPQRRNPMEQVAPGQFMQSFAKRYTPVAYALGDMIAEEDWRDDRYGVMTRLLPAKGGALARAHSVLREIVAAQYIQILGFAADPATLSTPIPTMADGRPLFSNYHPVSRQNNNVFFSNRPSVGVDLSNSSYQIAAATLRQQPMPNNVELRPNEPRILCVNPNQHYLAKQIISGEWFYNTADRNTNFAKDDNIKLVEWAYFRQNGTNAAAGNELAYNGWFIEGKEHFLNFVDRERVQIKTDYITAVLAYTFVSWAAFVVGADDSRGLYGSPGA
jgi:hypothetical protein